jgi:hypothetical protein
MKSKKADMFIGETIRIVLSVMVIVLLLYLSFSLYSLFTAKTDIQQAKAHMETIENIIKSLEENGGGSEDYILLSPKEWYLAGFESPLMDQIPQSCTGERCVCMCFKSLSEQFWEGGVFILKSEHLAESCNQQGICIDVEQKFLSVKPESQDLPYYPIIIDKHLIDNRKALKISLEKDKLTITTK